MKGILFVRRIFRLFVMYDFAKAVSLSAAYLSVIFHNRRGGGYETQENILGYRICFPRRHAFFSQFVEVFLGNAYGFSSEQRDPLIIDCGSNIGMSILFFKWQFPRAKILCFEPNPEAYRYLARNIVENHLEDIQTFPYAVGGEEGNVPMETSAVPASPGASLFRKTYRGEAPPVSVAARRLSSFIDSPVTLLKLDVEGAEGAVIEELAKSDALRFIRELWIEYHFDAVPAPYSLEDIEKELTRAGFKQWSNALQDITMRARVCMVHAWRE